MTFTKKQFKLKKKGKKKKEKRRRNEPSLHKQIHFCLKLAGRTMKRLRKATADSKYNSEDVHEPTFTVFEDKNLSRSSSGKPVTYPRLAKTRSPL